MLDIYQAVVFVLGVLLFWMTVRSRRTEAFFYIIGLYPFVAVAPAVHGEGAPLLSANLVVLPSLAVLVWRSWKTGPRLEWLDVYLVILGIWVGTVFLVQAGLATYGSGVAFKQMLWFLAWMAVRGQPHLKTRLAASLALCGAIVSLLTIQELYTGWNYFQWANPNQVDTAVIDRFGWFRVAGPFGHGVPTGIIVAMCMPFSLVLRRRGLGLALFALALSTLTLTQARGAWIGLIVAGAALVTQRVQRGRIDPVRALVGLTFVVLAVITLRPLLSWMTDVLVQSFAVEQSGENTVAIGASYLRVDAWLDLPSLMWSVPFFGFGLERVAVDFRTFATVNEWPVSFHLWFAYGPVLAVLVTACFLVGSVRLAIVRRSSDLDDERFRMAALAAFVVNAVALQANWVGFWASFPLALICLRAATISSNRTPEKAPAAVRRGGALWRMPPFAPAGAGARRQYSAAPRS